MKLLRAIFRTPRGRIVLAVLLLSLAWQGWLSATAPGKVAPAVRAAEGRKVNVLVTLAFPPERFHVLSFQKFGRVTGTQDNTVELRGVNKADLSSVARPHWVTKVEPLPPEGA
ncbi:hypothetical protein [Ramlibacter algicola]|uniref:Uncharacterized protein n=1 Tax=Ramlibacter algicola TaxID=2795217 RepID=A0A934Q3N9_9BURK|nr:hypothetical protein [Ramlibacter algicola]MBK0394588.1 hypothetical protein [Ramlibacter algicola]